MPKKKSCTKNCPPRCLADVKNHVPREHFIVAFSALVIALSGIILTGPSVQAATPVTQYSCKDSDGGLKADVAGKTVRSQVNTRTKLSNVLRTEKDYCKNKNVLVEYGCSKDAIVSKTIPCGRDQLCQAGACVNRNILPTTTQLPAVRATNTSTEYTSDLSIGQPALSGYRTATDGSWCQVHNTSTALAYCEDSRGVKVYAGCNADRSTIPFCGSVYSGTNDVYLNTKCVAFGYKCSEFNASCAMSGNTATCEMLPTTPIPAPTPSSTPSSTPARTPSTTPEPSPTTYIPPPTNTSTPAVTLTAEAPVAGSSMTQAILAGTHLGRFRITNLGTAKITVTSLSFVDSGTHTGNTTTFRLYYSDQNSSNFTGNTAALARPTVDFTGLDFSIDGGAMRYVTVAIHNIGLAAYGDTFQLSAPTLGSGRFSVAETDLGFDANINGSIMDTITNLPMDGKPMLGTYIKI